ncbi:MAG: hypothetical protein HeimC3_45470 [Candidatus Heimdallarchaeota archaeon LC_3]|nr:MAG: hypothetical protein HeimC3_45470 [Candidatus Heimdallarchaeota archaeon LC_3]
MDSPLPFDKDIKTKAELANFGIFGLYILTREGLPLIERNYKSLPGQSRKDGNNTVFGSDSLLVAGFFSAIAKFASEKISGLLSDIGFHTIRLFFDFTEELIFILVFDEMKLQMLPFFEIRTVCKGTISQVKQIFETYFSDEKDSGDKSPISQITRNMADLERLRDSFSKLYPQIDRILHKSFREVKTVLE